MKQYEIKKKDKFLYCELPGSNKVLSSGVQNGGIRRDIRLVFNHDCKPAAGSEIHLQGGTYESHLNYLAEQELATPCQYAAGFMTSAQMKNAAVCHLSCQPENGRDAFFVKAVITAGIDKNGSRAGEDAFWHENNGHFYPLEGSVRERRPGTINILLFIGANMTDGALVRAVMTATEAKCAAIQDLGLPSVYSDGIATGSGTDGIIIICDEDSELVLTEAGTYTKLGELIGKTVKQALKEALFKQTGVR